MFFYVLRQNIGEQNTTWCRRKGYPPDIEGVRLKKNPSLDNWYLCGDDRTKTNDLSYQDKGHMSSVFDPNVRGLSENVSFSLTELDSFIQILQVKRFPSFIEPVRKLVFDIISANAKTCSLKSVNGGVKQGLTKSKV